MGCVFMTAGEYEAMVRQHEKLVYTVCYQLVRDVHTAEDLAQDAFLSAWLHRDDCRPDARKAWLCRIAVNKAKDYLKSAHCRHTQVTADETLRLFSDTAPGPEQLAEDRDAARRALESIRTMDGPYRDVCTAYFVQERPAAQIALQLNRPARTVHTQIYRARARLRSQLATA